MRPCPTLSLIAQLRSILGDAAVLTEPPDVAPYVVDWRGRHRGSACCVVLPAATEQVAAIVRACVEARVPIVPQGGNTGLCGGAVPPAGDAAWVVLSLARMRRIRCVDIANNSISVDAGCVLETVHRTAAEHGRLYPISLGSEGSCQIGGTIGTNAGGTGVLRYGNTRDNVLGLEVVLPDGRIWDRLGGLRKDNTGFDLKHLFIGSEGTLGIVTGATLKLHPLPSAFATAWMAVPSPQAALDLMAMFQSRAGGVLSAYELLNRPQVIAVMENVADRRPPVDASHPWHVLVELADTGGEDALNDALRDVLENGLEQGLVVDAVLASSQAHRHSWWGVRHSVTEGNKKAGMGISTDIAVPLSAVPAFMEKATVAVHHILPQCPIHVISHLGDGNVHFVPLASFEQWASWENPHAMALEIKHAVNEVAVSMRGTFSGEHGVGQVLTSEMSIFKSQVELDLMRAVKSMIDPLNLFNPGRLLPESPARCRDV